MLNRRCKNYKLAKNAVFCLPKSAETVRVIRLENQSQINFNCRKREVAENEHSYLLIHEVPEFASGYLFTSQVTCH